MFTLWIGDFGLPAIYCISRRRVQQVRRFVRINKVSMETKWKQQQILKNIFLQQLPDEAQAFLRPRRGAFGPYDICQ